MSEHATTETPAKEHHKTREARLRREAEAIVAASEKRQAFAAPVFSAAESEAAAINAANADEDTPERSDEDRAAEIAASLRGPDRSMERSVREPIVLNPDPTATTIEGRIGLPPKPGDTAIRADMTQDDIDMLTAKAMRFVAPKAVARVRTTTFETSARAVPHRAEPQTVTLPAPTAVAAALKFTEVGGLMDFCAFANEQFSKMDKAKQDAIMSSNTPHAAFATMGKLYVAYVYCHKHAARAEFYAARGIMDFPQDGLLA